MSMRKIAKFLKINSGLYGTQQEEESLMSLPAKGRQRYRYAMLDLEGRPKGRTDGYYGTFNGELGAIFRDSSGRYLLD